MRGKLVAGLKSAAADVLKAADVAVSEVPEDPAVLLARAKALNNEGKYKHACEVIEEAYALQPKISTALSAANLRLKLGDYGKAVAAYRKVLAAVDSENGPSDSEVAMATRKLKEAEEAIRASAISIALLERSGPPRLMSWYADQLDSLSDELFSESASLYAEHGVELQDGLKEVSRLIRLRRLGAAGMTLKPVEKTITKACLAHRDDDERQWLTTVRSVLNGVRARAAEVQQALREFDEESSGGWQPAQEGMGIRTEWRPSEVDASLWIRMNGELNGAELLHAAAVAHEADLWPRWIPLCSAGEVVGNGADAMERFSWIQFDLPMMRRGALLHWSLSDSLLDRQSLLLLGASVPEHPGVERPAGASGVTLAEFRAIKVLVRPRSSATARIRCVLNLDLKVSALPQAIISMVTKKIAGAVLSSLMREAQKLSRECGRDASDIEFNVYHRRIEQRADFYQHFSSLITNYFDLYGEEDDIDD